MSSTTFVSFALSVAISTSPLASAFSPVFSNTIQLQPSSTTLKYRSLHHGPDVEPLSDNEKQGAAYTKMDKSMIDRFGPGDFTQYVDNDLFDGGDSEMGLVGDGDLGIKKVGRDSLPHMARTFAAKMEDASVHSMSYSDELLQNNPSMDAVRAQQLENWATQNEIAMSNKHMYGNGSSQDYYTSEYEYSQHESFVYPLEAGGESEGIVTLRAPVHGVAAEDIMLKNPYMGYARFRAGFVGDDANEWSVSFSDDYLKQNEDTHFVIRYSPHSPGVSNAYFVVETEDFKKTWKVVGSTGEYEF